MSLFQPYGAVELTRRNEKRLNRLERRANWGATVQGLMDRGLDNLIINGDFRINQRGYASGASLTPGVLTGYGHDRWRTAGQVNLIPNPNARASVGNMVANGVGTVTRQTGLTGGPVPGVTTFFRNTLAAGSGGFYPQTDSVAPYALVVPGVTYRISVWLRSSVNKTVSFLNEFINSTGTNISGNVTVASVNLVANVWARVDALVTAPAGAARIGPNVNATGWSSGQTLDSLGWMVTEGSTLIDAFDGASSGSIWLGSANASPSLNRLVQTSYYFTQTPNGCTITLNSGGAIQQVIERSNMPAGDYTVSWSGSSACRVYKNSTLTLLASIASGPLTFTTDGTDDIVVEFEAVGGTATLANVNLVAGTSAYPYRPRLIGEELALAQRYFVRFGLLDAQQRIALGVQATNTFSEVSVPVPVPMRPGGAVVPAFANLGWTDTYSFTAQVTSVYGVATVSDLQPGLSTVNIKVGYSASGAAARPGILGGWTVAGGYLDLSREF